MTGWIKMGTGLASHGKVKALRRALKGDRLKVIGGLWAVWCIFDEHSAAGRLDGYTLDDMDEEIGWKGFSAAMRDIGWLIETDDGLEAPDYEEHNGPNAKRRALDASRKGKSRAKPDTEPDEEGPLDPYKQRTEPGQVSASNADNLRNREEKRREEQKNKGISSAEPTLPGFGEGTDKPRPSIPCPYDAIVALYHGALPSLPGVRLMAPARQRAIRKVWGWVLSSTKPDGSRRATTADEALAWFGAYFARASDNDFLMGRSGRSAEHANWTPDLDFLLTDKGMKHVIEKTQEAA